LEEALKHNRRNFSRTTLSSEVLKTHSHS